MDSSTSCEYWPPAILHLVPFIGPQSGGLGPVAMQLTQEQHAAGYESVIWCLDDGIRLESSTATYVTAFPIVGPAKVGYSPAAEQAAVSDMSSRYHVLHQHGIWMAISRVTNRWRSAVSRPTVIAPHGSLETWALGRSGWKKRIASLLYERRNLKSAACLHATSPAEATSFRRYGLINPIAVIPNGVADSWLCSAGDADRFRGHFGIPGDKRVVLFLSRVHPKKGLPMLFEAMAAIRPQLEGWLLVIAGPSERGYFHELRCLIGELDIASLVRFIGPLWGRDKRDAFATAELFILPTHSENFGIVIAEALAAGVPVVTTRGAPWEELRTCRCGWWVDVDPTAIRDALLDAIQRRRGELVAMGHRGKGLVTEKYTWSQAARKSLQLYEWLVGHGERPDFVVID